LLADIAAYPIVTYTPEFTGRSNIDAAFARAGLHADIRLAAVDADVIKTYVKLGMGVGIVAQMAVENAPGEDFAIVPGSNGFFIPSTTKLAIPEGALLRNYAYRLVEMLAPHLDERLVKGARRPEPEREPDPLLPFRERHDLRIAGDQRAANDHDPTETVAA
jgi:LysR family cys regulon transcriptional activator